MSIVGPRPEVEEYISSLNEYEKIILSVRPGLTSPASIKFVNEEKILSHQKYPERFNKEFLYPEKTKLNIDYVNNYSIWGDIKIMLLTVLKVIKNVFER
jgi:Sugar transferases involved in lipopolysaccharide synthesis